ncbi:M4 family metallopeptidase [Vibrio sp. V39_P1S14PM300]|uniref:M4 family metallopeptidase n=1 Tax=Vibrio sp. V39_P1S14PM300 TaxID=1938690 RepID=UPI001F16C328|nr:M4 family metallopeptidase [Vibrio sp. V39_P1S14PM300]
MRLKSVAFAIMATVSSTIYALPSSAPSRIQIHHNPAKSFTLPVDVHPIKMVNLAKPGHQAKRYQQFVGLAEVWGAQLTTITTASGQTLFVIGKHYPGIMATNDVRISAAAAKGIAMMKVGGKGTWKVTLALHPRDGRYFYITENRRDDSRWIHWIDAETGVINNAYNALTTGSGIGVWGQSRDLSGLTDYNRGRFEMTAPRLSTYDAGGKTRLPGSIATDDDNLWDRAGRTSPGQAALVDAHYYAHLADKYFLTHFNFDWLDYYPQGIRSSAHVKRNYNNAFWNGSQMAYGDGDGISFTNMSGDLDVVGHELAHGITEATSNLIYQNESGALNEAFSDIMGTSLEFANNSGNWTIGEDIMLYDDGIRNMADPNADGDPSHYAQRYTGSGDNGGVHINSGIINHWFYLLSEGGVNANPDFQGQGVIGVGQQTAVELVYDAFTSLTPDARFCDARAATLAFADDAILTSVIEAWAEVGLDETQCGGGNESQENNTDGPLISSVGSEKLKGVKFRIFWTTDVASTTEVTFTCCGSYVNSALTTTHSYSFNGSKGATYQYFVTSRLYDTAGNEIGATTAGPFTHQN